MFRLYQNCDCACSTSWLGLGLGLGLGLRLGLGLGLGVVLAGRREVEGVKSQEELVGRVRLEVRPRRRAAHDARRLEKLGHLLRVTVRARVSVRARVRVRVGVRARPGQG